jgi:hypothetical protein
MAWSVKKSDHASMEYQTLQEKNIKLTEESYLWVLCPPVYVGHANFCSRKEKQ